MTLALRYAARSHVGMIRGGNEDAAYAGPRVLAVADGMGGHAAGEVAAAVAVAAVSALDQQNGSVDPLSALRTAVLDANRQLREMVAADRALDGMGTTITALLTDGPRAGLVHVGDSRAYILRDGKLTQLTTDHTFVQRLVDEGRIRPQDAGTHPQRSLITRALDGREDIELDLSMRELHPGDRYLLCSDGLSGVVSDETIAQTLGQADPGAAADALVDLALRAGGPDNITCIVAEVIDAPDAPIDVTPLIVGAASSDEPGQVDLGDSPAARAAVVTATSADAGAEGPRPDDTGALPAARPTPPRPAVSVPSSPGSVLPDDSVVSRGRTVRKRRAALVLAGLLLLIVGGAAGAWAYVQSQYYVGVDDGQVAIYRGVSGSVAGIELSRVSARPGPAVSELADFQRQRVDRGITAASRADADRIVALLRAEAQPPVPTAVPTLSPGSAGPSPSESP